MSPLDQGSALLNALGGLRLFLLGLALLREGLRSLAGQQLRRLLLSFTRSPLSGALTGACATALLQSSTAVMVATVGFVAAGLISFPASLGLVMGANVDSTSLGWLVALVGIRLQLSQLMLPLLLLGAGLKLLFLGLASLHVAMVSRGLLLEPGHFDTATSTGRLQLLALGFITTLITHSSGAGVTASPTALSAGALNLGQACALVIGMDMGSSITAQIAAIGSGLSARRTAMAHLLFTVVTAGLAFVLLPPYLQLLAAPSLPASQLEPAFALTLFQSGFNLLGLALLLPLTGPFAALIRQLVRASQEREVDDLDAIPPPQPDQALEPAAEALRQTFGDLVVHLGWSLGAEPGLVPPRPTGLDGLQGELDRVELYLDQIHVEKLEAPEGRRLLHLLHGLDHLQRLHERLEEEPDRARTVRSDPALADLRQELLGLVSELPQSLAKDHWLAASQASAAAAEAIGASVQPLRHRVMEAIATGEPELERGTRPSALGIQQMLAAGIQLLP
ncbi:Na/Pi cotransporter family protein [Vulcanococcus limneticus Candia 3F8]|uniref:Na/Pi symporter n=1 Tax=Vulcanococcus limneticus TaxID=2170428 RepID=UPI000B994F4C|nr:Na/Pi symporter [Vulcanococcus limneticus]MCP9792783.1 Na/Pi cotransporter family protein [Vulcanococcus limneticus MW73D5]MCP9894719.1 Na/Pi cotransporter family protein [Vulcanococcus limneticus Candia 3F8]MCP9898197.1 Na/Pi cotransporter family protein [Vulcanococcus limneticus Candia 3B3]